jgi:hypothetical protein
MLPRQASGRAPSEDTREFACSGGSPDRMLADCAVLSKASSIGSCAGRKLTEDGNVEISGRDLR